MCSLWSYQATGCSPNRSSAATGTTIPMSKPAVKLCTSPACLQWGLNLHHQATAPEVLTPLAPASGDIAHGIGHLWYFCLKCVDITLYPSSRALPRCRVLSMSYCPSMDPNREPRKTRESNPHRFHPELFSRQSRQANIRLSSWQRRPQVGAFLPSFRPVYGRSSAGSILTPEGSGCGRRSILHSILSARVARFELATSLRQSEALFHLSYTRDVSAG